MPELDDITVYCLSFEYNPCIRKGKHKPVYKKQKKYEAKVQRMNLIRPKRGKIINNNLYEIYTSNKDIYKELIDILKSGKHTQWNEDYYYLYKCVFHLDNDKELVEKYNKILCDIEQDKIDEFYEEYEEYEDYRWYGRYGRSRYW